MVLVLDYVFTLCCEVMNL